MAYIDQTRKAAIAPKVKEILAKYGLKGSLSIKDHSELVLSIKSGKIDFIQNTNTCMREWVQTGSESIPARNYVNVNKYYLERGFTGIALEALRELVAAMNDGNHDNSDSQSDHFDVGWHININIGRWDTPYVLME